MSAATEEVDRRIAILHEFALSKESEKIHRALIPKLFSEKLSFFVQNWLIENIRRYYI